MIIFFIWLLFIISSSETSLVHRCKAMKRRGKLTCRGCSVASQNVPYQWRCFTFIQNVFFLSWFLLFSSYFASFFSTLVPPYLLSLFSLSPLTSALICDSSPIFSPPSFPFPTVFMLLSSHSYRSRSLFISFLRLSISGVSQPFLACGPSKRINVYLKPAGGRRINIFKYGRKMTNYDIS